MIGTSGLVQKGFSMSRQIDAMISLLTRLMSFRGRVGRGDFWAIFLFTLLIWCAFPILLIVQVTSPFVLAAFTARRLHDLDKPGWWTIPFLAALLPLAIIWALTGRAIFSALAGSGALEPVSFGLTAGLASVVAIFLYLLSLKGSAERNEHGAPCGDFDLPYLLMVR
jgi:uncharacterized membrane protein YhaH (DUF805 family)